MRRTDEYIASVIWKRFLPVPGVDKRRLRLNLEGAYSLTPHNVSQAMLFELSQLMQQHWQTTLAACSVLECFAGQGGDTVAFVACARPHTLHAIEHNVANFCNLINNIAEYQRVMPMPQCTTVMFMRENAVDVLRRLSHKHKRTYDIIYMDPPWGGPTYRRQSRPAPLRIPHASSPTVAELVAEVLPCCKLLVLKVPVSFELAPLQGVVVRTTVYDDKIRFMYLVNR